MFLNFLCRNMEIQYNSLRILSHFVNSEECQEILREASGLITFLLETFTHAMRQSDYRTKKFSTNYGADVFLQVTWNFCAASDEFSKALMEKSCLQELSTALALDPNKEVNAQFLGRIVNGGVNTLWHILLSNRGKYVETIRKYEQILQRIFLHFKQGNNFFNQRILLIWDNLLN